MGDVFICDIETEFPDTARYFYIIGYEARIRRWLAPFSDIFFLPIVLHNFKQLKIRRTHYRLIFISFEYKGEVINYLNRCTYSHQYF